MTGFAVVIPTVRIGAGDGAEAALVQTGWGLSGAGCAVGDEAAFLGVERSASGRRWRLRGIADDASAAALTAQLALPEILARLLTQRGVGLEEAARFLSPRLRDQLPDPAHLKDMDRAVDRLVGAIRDREKIVVFGDYDVDGATSAALLLRFLAAVGAAGDLYVPDRLREGYGPNAAALLRLKERGAGLVVCVDCGTTAHDALGAAKAAGLDLIVIDHHVAEPLLPTAVAVVNPNRLDEASTHGHLAAVGVAFLLVVGANRALRDAGWYASRPEPDLMQWLDLVALGTVCDVVPLTGLNRALVSQGLKIAQRGANPGIAALAALGAAPGRPPAIDAYQLGFILGPRVNAGGRVGAAELGARLLSTDDAALAAEWAQNLDAYNKERREIERATLDAAIELVERQNNSSAALVFAAAEGWHPGVIGIVAARLKERYGRPAVVVALGDGVGKGSGRSVPGLALGAAVIAARQQGLLMAGGGHAMAAGFTVAADRLVELQAFLAARLQAGIDAAGLVPELAIDAALGVEAAQGGLLAQLDALAPFGSANPEPRFAFPMVRATYVEPVGTGHLRLRLTDALANGSGVGGTLGAIAFRAADTPLGRLIAEAKGRALHVAGHLRRDTWRGGDAVQLVLDDAATAEIVHG
ncbi:MAG: single-stranded-DNA-specific exonuclease RecJ [Alphaproteobacteria bacterium]|nr:single-stranded-DNA-specific exonuclease RecJ [Alphaproteobacteria bacterium]